MRFCDLLPGDVLVDDREDDPEVWVVVKLDSADSGLSIRWLHVTTVGAAPEEIVSERDPDDGELHVSDFYHILKNHRKG